MRIAKKQPAPQTEWWSTNEHGAWCPSCGELLSHRDEDFSAEECPTCGYPEDIEKMAEFHVGEE